MERFKYEKIQQLEEIGELLNTQAITTSEFDYLKEKILNGEPFKMPRASESAKPPQINFKRIRAAGYAANDIFWCVIWQLVVGFIYGVYVGFKYSQLEQHNDMQTLDTWEKYDIFLNIGLSIIELVIFYVIIRSLWDLGQNLIKANIPFKQSH